MTEPAGGGGPDPDRRVTGSVEETERLGERLGAALRAGDVIVLEGPLGAGKTRFVAGLARGLGVRSRVRSPSFTLLNEYRGDTPLCHVDLYRLESADVDGLGLEERREEAVLAVEWGGRLPAWARAEALTLTFEILAERERAVTASAAAAGRGAELRAWWQRAGAAETAA